jgi:hypothetical protein
MTELAKLGVENITCESREEWEAKRLGERYISARESLNRNEGPWLSTFAQPEPIESSVGYARSTARELLAAGERIKAVELVRNARRVERMARERWPEFKPRHLRLETA